MILSEAAIGRSRAIFIDGVERFGFEQADRHVADLRARCDSVETFPKRNAVSRHTGRNRRYRAFTFKAHKVFHTVDDETRRAGIAAILPGRMDHRRML